MRKMPVIVVATAICMLLGFAGYQNARSDVEGWREIAWPFPRDGWPAGRAFACAAAICGDDVELYLRPKAGFCNCDTGVADDDEVDRVADLDLITERFVPLEAGKVVRVAGMPGRLRTYNLNMPDGSRHSAVGVAVAKRCDLFIAVAQGKDSAPAVQHVAMDFLATGGMSTWMIEAMDSQ